MDRRRFRPASIIWAVRGGEEGGGGGRGGGIGDQRAETLSWASGNAPKAVPMDLLVLFRLDPNTQQVKKDAIYQNKA